MTILLFLSAVIAALVLYLKNPFRVGKQKRRMARRQRRAKHDRYWKIYDRLFARLNQKRLTYKSDKED